MPAALPPAHSDCIGLRAPEPPRGARRAESPLVFQWPARIARAIFLPAPSPQESGLPWRRLVGSCLLRSYGAFAETFLRQPGRTLIDTGLLRRKAYVRLEITADLTLIRLAGPSLAILGATAEVVHGGLPYDAPQAWSKALFDHPLRPDGIAYYARHDDEGLCYAIFDRARRSLREINRELGSGLVLAVGAARPFSPCSSARFADRYGLAAADVRELSPSCQRMAMEGYRYVLHS